jgi:hypothetical protein
VLLLRLDYDGVEMREDFGHGDGVDLAVGVISLLDELLQMASGDLDRKLVGDDLAGALFLLNPCLAGQSDPHRALVDIEADVDGIGMAGGDGHNVGLPRAVEVFSAPAIGHMEIFVHALSVTFPLFTGKRAGAT